LWVHVEYELQGRGSTWEKPGLVLMKSSELYVTCSQVF